MSKTWRSPESDIKAYHAHIYYSDETAASLHEIYAALQKFGAGRIHLNSIAKESRGPHVMRMFGVDIPKAELESVLGFLLLNHGPHSVLIHPVTKNELLDHTHHALWLGVPQALNLSVLVE